VPTVTRVPRMHGRPTDNRINHGRAFLCCLKIRVGEIDQYNVAEIIGCRRWHRRRSPNLGCTPRHFRPAGTGRFQTNCDKNVRAGTTTGFLSLKQLASIQGASCTTWKACSAWVTSWKYGRAELNERSAECFVSTRNQGWSFRVIKKSTSRFALSLR